jgi:hypothetical protein
MGKPLASLLIPFLVLVSTVCNGQMHTAISYPIVEISDHEVHIYYDIVNSGPDDRFNVSLLITDTHGQELNVSSLSGDVGANISGGSHKHIIWNRETDQVVLEGPIEVRIMLEATSSVHSGNADPELNLIDLGGVDPSIGEDGISKNELLGGAESTVQPKTFSRTGLVFQSLLFPGWGLSRVNKGPHWVKGLAAYGCVAGSVYLNRKAVDTYARIDTYQDYQDKDDLYQKALQQDNISEVLAFTAAGIWVVDFIWTLVGTSDLKKKHKKGSDSGLSLITEIDPFTYAPMVGIHISF